MAALVITPDATTQLYKGQILTLTATLTGSPSPIDLKTDYVTFTLTGMVQLYPSSDLKVALTPDPQTPTTGTATLDVYVTYFGPGMYPPSVTATTNILIATTPTNTYPAVKELEVTATSGPTKTYIPSAPNNTLTPFDDNGTYTSTMSVTVFEKGTTTGVPNIYVHWLQEYSFELYYRASPFGIDFSQTPPVDPKVTVPLDPMSDPFHAAKRWEMVRTPTDANGVATLYLVSKTTDSAFTRFFGKVLVMTNYYELDAVGEVFSADLTKPQFGEQPVPKGLEDGVLTLSDDAEPNVPVHVPFYPSSRSSDRIFLLLNGELYDSVDYNNNVEYIASVPKSAIYSDTGPHAGQDNTLVFAAGGGVGAGGIRVSGTQTFKAKGTAASNAPDPNHYPGVLDYLDIENTSSFIYYELTQGDITVNIPMQQFLYWTPAVGDKITLTFYINAYAPGTNNPKRAILPPRGTDATKTLVAGDLGPGKEKYPFIIDGSLFADYDRQSGPPYHLGTFKAVYKVEPVGGGATLYSRIVDGTIDTTPTGKRKESAS